MAIKHLVRTLLVFTLATSISAFAGSKNPGAAKSSNVNGATTETKASPCVADPQTDHQKVCVICQVQSEDSNEKAARQELIQNQEEEWSKNLYNQ
jgi:hypothetical protein